MMNALGVLYHPNLALAWTWNTIDEVDSAGHLVIRPKAPPDADGYNEAFEQGARRTARAAAKAAWGLPGDDPDLDALESKIAVVHQ